jgi:hypothetical protein
MAQFTRHVGKHGDRKVAVVFREVPGEPHMALVVYTETLNRTVHDPLVKCIESDIGQHSEDLAVALNRSYTTDGQVILQKLHSEGMLKKVQTELIVMTPQPNTRIKLNELNKILDEMKMGEEAVRKLANMDSQLGIQDPVTVARRMRGDKDAFTPETMPSAATGLQASGDALGDTALASNLRGQAERMSIEAKGLIAEAQRLIEQAQGLDPVAAASTKKVAKTTVSSGTEAKTRGRPKKTPVTS